MFGSGDVVKFELAALLISKNFVVLLWPLELFLTQSVLAEKIISVGTLLVDLLLTLRVLDFCLLSQLVLISLTGLVTVSFFPLFGIWSETLVLRQRFLCFLQDVVSDLQTLSLLYNITLPILLSLNFDHVIVFWAVTLFLSFEVLFTFKSLFVEVMFESLLELTLLGQLILSVHLLHFVLVSQDSAPLIKDFLLLFDGQMASPLRRWDGQHSSLSVWQSLRCHRELLCIWCFFGRRGHRLSLIRTTSTLPIDALMLFLLCYRLDFIYWAPLRGSVREFYGLVFLHSNERLLQILRSPFLLSLIRAKKGGSGISIITSRLDCWCTFLRWLN